MGKLSMWGDKVVKHFWYCCQNCNGNLETLKVSEPVYARTWFVSQSVK